VAREAPGYQGRGSLRRVVLSQNGPHVAGSVYHSARVCYAQQCASAGRCSLLAAAARIVRCRVIGPSIVRCSVSIGRPARSSANRLYLKLL